MGSGTKSKLPFILGGNNAPGSEVNLGSSQNSLDTILKNFEDERFANIAATGKELTFGVESAPGGNGIKVNGTNSIFNPFYVFRYAKFATKDGYNYDLHRDISGISQNSTVLQPSAIFSDNSKETENPSAAAIIRWAQENADKNIEGSTLGGTPYQWNDFLWCSYYGQIPNNRLLTLRRYPIPVEDNLQINDTKMPLIPIAQAVTWWGGETGNKLSDVLGIDYGFKWIEKTAKVQDVTGNEVDANNLLDLLGVSGDPTSKLRQLLLSTFFADGSNPYQGTGLDQKFQEWVKGSYGDDGPYWNRVLGPVNVINSTQIRNTGFSYDHNIKLKFSYKLRSFNNVNPKVAFLDLITNFLSLTHNKAEFWGGGIRYFQKTGYILNGLPTQKFDDADFVGGIKELLVSTLGAIQQKVDGVSKFIKELAGSNEATATATAEKAADKILSSKAVNNMAGVYIKDLLQGPLLMRSFLDGRAVGEWHVTVGNPMNPIAVIGNLCLKNTTIEFSDSLGLDDFPTEITFTVNLIHGRPRAKQDIESMFNLGGGSMGFTALAPPSSARQTLGKANSDTANEIMNSKVNEDNLAQKQDLTNSSLSNTSQAINIGDKQSNNPTTLQDASKLAIFFEDNVRRSYGEKFSKSGILAEYFRDLKTKD